MKQKPKKLNTGITLVALVITVIILLILAGISIATLTGSGLFEKAKLAEQESKNAQELEDSTLGDYENKISEYIDGNRNTVTEDNIVSVNITTPSTSTKAWVKIADFPNGYTYDNCHIINGYIQRTSDKVIIPLTYDEHWSILLRTTINGIEMSLVKNSENNADFSSFLNRPGKIYLQKDI